MEEYKVRCENEEGDRWIVWIPANTPSEAEDIAIDDPNVAGCEVVGVR